MNARLVYSAERTCNQVLRTLDGERRTVLVLVPWDQRPLDTYRMVQAELTDEERVALADALYVNPLAATDDGPA